MPEIDYQGIFNELLKVLPPWWEEIDFVAKYKDDDYQMSTRVYKKSDQGGYDYCDLPEDINNDNLRSLCSIVYQNIDKILSKQRKELNDQLGAKNVWASFKMSVDHEGNMHADFGYED